MNCVVIYSCNGCSVLSHNYTNGDLLPINHWGTDFRKIVVSISFHETGFENIVCKFAHLSGPQCVRSHAWYEHGQSLCLQKQAKSAIFSAPTFHWPLVINFMMTSWNGNIFRVTDPLWGESTGHRWFPSQRPVTRSFDFYLRLNKRFRRL